MNTDCPICGNDSEPVSFDPSTGEAQRYCPSCAVPFSTYAEDDE